MERVIVKYERDYITLVFLYFRVFPSKNQSFHSSAISFPPDVRVSREFFFKAQQSEAIFSREISIYSAFNVCIACHLTQVFSM